MIGIEITFVAGRFHGNAWHRAHNEGVSEWPPSPWRVLRALVNASCVEAVESSEVDPLLEKLRSLPRYRLPPAVEAHTRHYMPDTDDADHRRTKVFDTFVAIDGGSRNPAPVTIAWSSSLTAAERALLARLCNRVTYLGRTESWADLRMVDVPDGLWDCWPEETGPGPATTLLAPSAPDALGGLLPNPELQSSRPSRLWQILTFDGARYRSEGWSAVPGTRLVRYRFANQPFRRTPAVRQGRSVDRWPKVARFAIRSPVLPHVHDVLAIAERTRLGIMSCSRKVSGDSKPVFSGHGVVGNHIHARYLPVALNPENAARRVVDHVLVVAEAGFDEEDVIALQELRGIWTPGGNLIRLMLTGLGHSEDFGGTREFQIPILAHARVWESVTPFIPTRHPKRVRGFETDSIEEQIRRSCRQLRQIEPTRVVPLGDAAYWAGFRRWRTEGGGSRGPDRAFGARLFFDRPISGPLAIGYGSHFGLGLFRAVE